MRAQWLRVWAFGTSPHGLGLSPEAFWSLDGDEYEALKDVYETTLQRWAMEQATFHNAHFDTQGTPWIAEDFMGRSTREDRKRQQTVDAMAVHRLNMELMAIKPGAPPPGCPDWAIGEYHGGR